MPIYEYQCQSCGHELEKIQRMNDDPLTDCPDCGEEELRRLISAAGFLATFQFSVQSNAQDATALGAQQKTPEEGVFRENGTIDGAFSIPIVNKLPGTTRILSLVPNGSVVQKGDLLFELDDSSLQDRNSDSNKGSRS